MARSHALIVAACLLATMPAISHAGGKYVAPVDDPLTKKVCGECHMAFPPGFLPGRSWSALMRDMSDHFGEDVQAYGYAASFDLEHSCEDEVVDQLVELRRRAAAIDGHRDDEMFFGHDRIHILAAELGLPWKGHRP